MHNVWDISETDFVCVFSAGKPVAWRIKSFTMLTVSETQHFTKRHIHGDTRMRQLHKKQVTQHHQPRVPLSAPATRLLRDED